MSVKICTFAPFLWRKRIMKQAKRIQTSLLNGVEKRALVYMAERMPKWVTSDMLSGVGVVGAVLIAAGYILSDGSLQWLWLSTLGFVVHWFGDSMDGTLARVRNTQRPIYGYYLDHTLDVITEGIMFVGIGLSHLVNMELAMAVYVLYLALTLNVSINAHLKSEFRLTYFHLGPTEFRVLMIIINTLYIYIPSLSTFRTQLYGHELTSMDCCGIGILLILGIIYTVTLIYDLYEYNKMDPLPRG